MTPRIAVIATGSASGETGGAERFYEGLRKALCVAGARAETISIVSDESNFRAVQESYLRFYDADLDAYDGVISTKAPGYLVRHRNHVCYLQHTMRVFYDMFEGEISSPTAEHFRQRTWIQRVDTAALSSARIRQRFVIGHEVRERLLHYNGLDADVLYQDTTLSGFRSGEFRYLFMPTRLHRWKRVRLVVEAMLLTRSNAELLVAGTGEDERAIRNLAAGFDRVKFLGRISDAELLDRYGECLAVPFVPMHEDFGLVAIEAFNSGKPVITCTDSGEPARMVRESNGGIVCDPQPAALALAIDRLAEHPPLARSMGANGQSFAKTLSWSRVAQRLLAALGYPAESLAGQIA